MEHVSVVPLAFTRLTVVAITAVALASCSAWHHIELLQPGPFDRAQQVQVWHGGQVDQWHAVVVTPDWISGIPFLQPIECDSCRTALRWWAVDSLRIGSPVRAFWKSVALFFVVPLVTVEVVCSLAARRSCWPAPD